MSYKKSLNSASRKRRIFYNFVENIVQQGADAMPTSPAPAHDATAPVPGFLRRYWLAFLMIAVISLLHYNTAWHIHALHGIYRRLYYFPIILAAFRGETRGGLLAALLVVALYVPHAFGLIGFDPGTTVEKILEMGLYLAVGLLTGTLVARINRARDVQTRTAADLRRALAEKTAMEAELVRAARLAAVGRLSAGLAHEIRNPLASIQGSAEVLEDEFPAGHPKAGMMGILRREADRLNQVLTRFLTFARNEPGDRAAFDLRDEIRAVAELMAHRPRTPGFDLEGLPPDLPAVMGDREQIRQVLLNLALNGAAAAGPAGRVAFSCRWDERTVTCLVTDTGPGFSAEDIANFGTPFYSTRDEGTGLGLAISLKIVEDHGGTLAVAAGGPGGRVAMTLPRAG
jgi:signal transduction histidine kinase